MELMSLKCPNVLFAWVHVHFHFIRSGLWYFPRSSSFLLGTLHISKPSSRQCESVGSVLCYTLSSLLAPPLLALPFYRARVETWRVKIMGDPAKGKKVGWDGVFAFLVVLRIAPFPPHWIANFVAPHLGIGVGLFWAACFVGELTFGLIKTMLTPARNRAGFGHSRHYWILT